MLLKIARVCYDVRNDPDDKIARAHNVAYANGVNVIARLYRGRAIGNHKHRSRFRFRGAKRFGTATRYNFPGNEMDDAL